MLSLFVIAAFSCTPAAQHDTPDAQHDVLDTREPDPTSVREALAREDSEKWQEAIDSELGSMAEHGVWEICTLPPGKRALPSHDAADAQTPARRR